MKPLYKWHYSLLIIVSVFFTNIIVADEILKVVCNKAYPEAMMELQEAIHQYGYKVSRVQKVDEGLRRSGYQSSKYRIVFFGHPTEFIKIKEKYPEIIPLLPLKFALYEDKENSIAVTPDPKTYAKLFNKKKLNAIFLHWSKDINNIIQSFKSRCQ